MSLMPSPTRSKPREYNHIDHGRHLPMGTPNLSNLTARSDRRIPSHPPCPEEILEVGKAMEAAEMTNALDRLAINPTKTTASVSAWPSFGGPQSQRRKPVPTPALRPRPKRHGEASK